MDRSCGTNLLGQDRLYRSNANVSGLRLHSEHLSKRLSTGEKDLGKRSPSPDEFAPVKRGKRTTRPKCPLLALDY